MAGLVVLDVFGQLLIITLHLLDGLICVLWHHLLQIIINPLVLDALFRVLETERKLLPCTQALAIAISNVLCSEHTFDLWPQRLWHVLQLGRMQVCVLWDPVVWREGDWRLIRRGQQVNQRHYIILICFYKYLT